MWNRSFQFLGWSLVSLALGSCTRDASQGSKPPGQDDRKLEAQMIRLDGKPLNAMDSGHSKQVPGGVVEIIGVCQGTMDTVNCRGLSRPLSPKELELARSAWLNPGSFGSDKRVPDAFCLVSATLDGDLLESLSVSGGTNGVKPFDGGIELVAGNRPMDHPALVTGTSTFGFNTGSPNLGNTCELSLYSRVKGTASLKNQSGEVVKHLGYEIKLASVNPIPRDPADDSKSPQTWQYCFEVTGPSSLRGLMLNVRPIPKPGNRLNWVDENGRQPPEDGSIQYRNIDRTWLYGNSRMEGDMMVSYLTTAIDPAKVGSLEITLTFMDHLRFDGVPSL